MNTNLTKPQRLKLLKAIGARILLHEKIEHNKINVAPTLPIKKKRGRPPKVVSELIHKIETESFDYDKLRDDAGVILPKSHDIEDELKTMRTKPIC